jgi:hypothetical protein
MTRTHIGFAAALIAACCCLVGIARADDKKADCRYCHAVQKVTSKMRCDHCKAAEKACDHCADMAKKVADSAACEPCGEKGAAAACGDCSKMMPEDAGTCMCAAKRAVSENTYCCKKCASAKKADCKKCKEMRAAVAALACDGDGCKCADCGKH